MRTEIAVGALGAASAVGFDKLKQALADDGDSGPSRAYRFKRPKHLEDEIRRVAAGRMDDAVEQLRERADDDLAAAVHEARKDLKKLRALVRLARPGLGDDRYRRENERARDAGRLLAGARDAQVKLDTLGAICERYSESEDVDRLTPYADRLEEKLEATTDDDEGAGAAEAAACEIERARRELEDWSVAGDGWEPIEDGLARSYRRGRRRYRAAAKDPSGTNMHEWRKRVKDHWYHLRLLRNAWRPVLKPAADEAHELADLIGDDHDLVVLREDAMAEREAFDRTADLKLLGTLVEQRRAELIDSSLKLGGRVYAESPKRFAKRVGTYWEVWQNSS